VTNTLEFAVTDTPPATPAQPKKAAVAAWIGSALEYYDNFLSRLPRRL